jgi:CRISPR-associated protein Cas5t
MEALHVQIEAFTASYSYPFLKSGTQLTLPVPPFSGILGNLSACAGRQIAPDETLIGFEFESKGKTIDLERTRRLQTDSKHGRLSENPERGIAKREFHVGPKLDLYLTSLALEANLYAPAAAPCLGRSQDLGWINFVRRIQLIPADSGRCGPTIVRFPNTHVGGLILPPIVDFYVNSKLGFIREAGRYSRYQFIRKNSHLKRSQDLELYHPSDSKDPEHAIVLHNLG